MSIVAVCALLVWGLAGDGDAAPAPPVPAAASGPRRLSVSVTPGATRGGPAPEIEAALRAAGYDGTFYGCISDLCSGPTAHPYSDQVDDPFESWTLTLRYRHDARLGVALVVAWTPLQQTLGFKSDTPSRPGFEGDYAKIDSEVTVVAALASLGAADFAWVGVGPSVNLVRLEDQLGGRSSKATTFGVVAEAGARWPPRSRVFLELKAQYRWAASAEMSLFEFAPSASVSASHATVAVGLGVRLGSPVGRPGN
jgi:hypothetical protein